MTRMVVSAVIMLLIATIKANLVDRGEFWGVTSEKSFMFPIIPGLSNFT